MAALGYRLAQDGHAHLPAALEDVDAVGGVVGVHVDLLRLLEPGIHFVPDEGDVSAEVKAVGGGPGVAPGGVFSHFISNPDRPVNRLSEVGRTLGVAAGLQPLGAHILLGEVVKWASPPGAQQMGALAIGDELPAEPHSHPFRAGDKLILNSALGGVYLRHRYHLRIA
jgi:hypothetical protein